MKKLLSIVLNVTMLLGMTSSVFAANGDIAGKIYTTDIKACINGVWVDSYNIGGKTVVIVEDITNQYKYSDALRTLEIDDLSPECLVRGSNTSSKNPGSVIGNIYKTDIKTYFRGKELTSYSLNGKMAVVLEELGADNTFSDIGGKFVWNPENRTIILESMYRYPYSMRTMMEDTNYNIVLTYSNGVLTAEPVAAPLDGGYILCEKEISDNTIIPVTYKDEIIGYRCSFAEKIFDKDEDGKFLLGEKQTPVDYFYTNKVEDMIFEAGRVNITADDWLNYFKIHTLSTVNDSFETDEYIFLYMYSSYVMTGSDRLIKLNKADGTKIEYQDFISPKGNKRFENVVIDKENEKVYLNYGGDYVINLKNDEVRNYNKLETDIGTISTDGEPSKYNEICARNSQKKYKLISGEDEKIVNGFFCNEYYYAAMLPLKETFEFLNVKYSFKNDVLTIDTSEARPFAYEATEEKTNFMGGEAIDYLYVDKVMLNGEETEITYKYSSGHFENMYIGTAKASPYVCNGKVYINDSFISRILNN